MGRLIAVEPDAQGDLTQANALTSVSQHSVNEANGVVILFAVSRTQFREWAEELRKSLIKGFNSDRRLDSKVVPMRTWPSQHGPGALLPFLSGTSHCTTKSFPFMS